MLMPCISDVWSPSEDQRPKVASKATQSMKDRFLSHLKEKNLLTIRARRASAESLSSNLVSPKGQEITEGNFWGFQFSFWVHTKFGLITTCFFDLTTF